MTDKQQPSSFGDQKEETIPRDAQRKAQRGIMNNCPFCKSHAVALVDYTTPPKRGASVTPVAWVSCIKCDAEGPVCSTTLEAIQRWNGAKR